MIHQYSRSLVLPEVSSMVGVIESKTAYAGNSGKTPGRTCQSSDAGRESVAGEEPVSREEAWRGLTAGDDQRDSIVFWARSPFCSALRVAFLNEGEV